MHNIFTEDEMEREKDVHDPSSYCNYSLLLILCLEEYRILEDRLQGETFDGKLQVQFHKSQKPVFETTLNFAI